MEKEKHTHRERGLNIQPRLFSLTTHGFLGDRGDLGDELKSSKPEGPDSPP